MQDGWIFEGRREGCPFYVYLEEEEEGRQMTRLEMQEKAMDLFMKHLH